MNDIELLKKMNEMIKKFIAKASSKQEENVITPDLQAKIDLAKKEHENGATLCFNNAQDAIAWMESI